MSQKNIVEIKSYDFTPGLVGNINDIPFVTGCWPLVYILSDEKTKEAYIGETTDAVSRLSTHLRNTKKKVLKTVRLIMSDKFNKSATLDIESNLIKYMSGDGQYKLLNGNVGLANHTYYQQNEMYSDMFKAIWSELRTEGIVQASLESINNSDLFKYSPYKTLTQEQKVGLIVIIKALLDDTIKTVMIEGGAGTGKSILAIYLFKLLHTDPDELDFKDFGDEEAEFVSLVRDLQLKYPAPKTGLVIPMSSFRDTLQRVFRNVKGLRANMVIGPAEVATSIFDILVVDESHRLRKRVNLGAYFGAFDKVNEKLGLPKDEGNELKWVLKQSRKSILFYDRRQSIKPSDVDGSEFETLGLQPTTSNQKLQSQLRSLGGNDYVSYIDRLLYSRLRSSDDKFFASAYDFRLYDSLPDMVAQIKAKNEENGLSRLIAGYSWKWVSQNNPDNSVYDIETDGVKLKWNGTNKDWINSETAVNEVGCIHTTQGYDLNYAGIIFGNEISYDFETNQIVIKEEYYFDKNGKQSIKSPDELREYIINIYKTIMLRAIRGTYVYVCDPELRKYFKQHIHQMNSKLVETAEVALQVDDLFASPYLEEMVEIDLYDSIGCGELMYAETTSYDKYEVPKSLIRPGAKYFVLRTRGDSMNQLDINDGDYILCQKNFQAPSGSIAVVIIGDDATLKEIHFEKDALLLKPKSTNPIHQPYRLGEGDEFKVLGVYIKKV